MRVSSRYRKDELAGIYERFFSEDTGWILNRIPRSEWSLLSSLLDKKQNEYVECPRNDEQFLFLQKCFLVLTYETKDTWHLYMCDSIRNVIKKSVADSIGDYPALQKMERIMSRFTELSKQLMEFLEENDPYRLSRSDRKSLRKNYYL